MTEFLGSALSSPLDWFNRMRMQQNTTLKEWKSCLSIAAAFDPFDFIDKALDHSIAPGLGTSIDDSFCIVSQSLHKVSQFSNA